MSFGFGVGDFIAVFQLAKSVRDGWIDAPKEYKSIKDETRNVENILRDIGQLGTRITLSRQLEADLERHCQSCREVLEEYKEIFDKHPVDQKSASAHSRLRCAWNRVRLNSDDVRHLREKLSAQITQLNSLYDIIEIDIVVDVREVVQDLQQSDAQRERTMVADWYSPPNFANYHSDKLDQREDGTGGWFLACAEYQQWRQQANSTLLCPGIKGSGKSVMVATVINDLQMQFRASTDVIVVYLYCDFNRQNEQDLRSMLATLTRQLFQEQARLPEVVTALHKKHRDRATRPSLEELKLVLRLLVNLHHRVFVVVDALDECENTERQRDQLLDELFSLQKSRGNNINVLATTRFIPDIVQHFSGHPQLEIRAAEGDIQVYLVNHVDMLAQFVSQDMHLQEEIRDRIVDAAEGMFLLARLQLESLRDKTNPGKMRRALAELKKGFDALDKEYAKTIERIKHQLPGFCELAWQVLLWITHARRQLSIDELREAIAIQALMEEQRNGTGTGSEHHTYNLVDYLDDEDQIVSVCQGLVEIDQKSRIVRLVHYSTQEFFERTRSEWLQDGHVKITRSCLTYLSMNVFAHDQHQWSTDLTMLIQQHGFLEYAGKYWGIHARASQDKELQVEVVSFLSNAGYLRFSAMITFGEWSAFMYKCWLSNISATHLSSYFGLHLALQDLIRGVADINHRDSDGRTPLSCAAMEGHTATVQLLLSQPGNEVNSKDARGHTPLSYGAERGYTEIVQLLLTLSDVDVNSRDVIDGTPLSSAAMRGHTAVVQLLLTQTDIEVNACDDAGCTALSYAAEGGHTEIVELLLNQSGIEVNTRDEGDYTPLSHAAKAGYTKIVQLLLTQPGIDVNNEDYFRYTPLSHAAKQGHTKIVQLLLTQSGINLNSRNILQDTPLSHAAWGGYAEIVQLLLAQPGIEVNKGDALSQARSNGHTAIVQLLLAHPDIEVT